MTSPKDTAEADAAKRAESMGIQTQRQYDANEREKSLAAVICPLVSVFVVIAALLALSLNNFHEEVHRLRIEIQRLELSGQSLPEAGANEKQEEQP